MQTRDNFSPDISVDEGFRKFEMFCKDIQFLVTSDEANKRDRSIRNIIDLRQTEFGRRQDRAIPSLLNDLERSFAFKAAISMALVMKEFKILGLGSELEIIPKPLPSKEPPVVSIIEALDNSITPRFSNGGKDYFDPQQQTESENNAKGTGVTIASPKTEFVVDLEEVRDPHGLPAADQAQSHGLVVFSSLGMEKDSVTVEIHDIE